MASIKLLQSIGQSEYMSLFRSEICGSLITVQHIQTLFTSDGCQKNLILVIFICEIPLCYDNIILKKLYR
jgi:hypothetical protein